MGKTTIDKNGNKHAGGMPAADIPMDDIRKLAKILHGNKSKVAEKLGVSRPTLRKWEKEHPEITDMFRAEWGKRLDQYLDTAHVLAVGVLGKDEDGNPVYTTPPDPNMLRFMIEKYGRMEGFGEELTINANVDLKTGVPIAKWINDNSE